MQKKKKKKRKRKRKKGMFFFGCLQPPVKEYYQVQSKMTFKEKS